MTGQSQTYNTKADVVVEDLVPTQRDSSSSSLEKEAAAVEKAMKAVLDVKEEKKKEKEKEARRAAKKAEKEKQKAKGEDVEMAGSDDNADSDEDDEET
jgi:nucleolar protein 58